MKSFDYFKPQFLDEVWKLKQEFPRAKFIAGGTDLMVSIKNNDFLPSALISLRSIPELNGIEINTRTRIGAAVTISDILQHPILKNNYPILGDAAHCMGSVQIRNVATLGGNICNCSPCADMATVLLVLEAKVRLQTAQSSREIPLYEFFLGPGTSCLNSDEILTDILLEPPHQNTQTIFLKKGRVKMDLAIASIALLLHMERKKCLKARLAAGSVAPVPLRLYEVERLLEGAVITRDIIAEAQKLARKSVAPISDIRSSAEYRREIIGVYIQRGLEQILAGSQT
jgi:carbon-monoxide dehydrogenase medium subunit